MHIKKHFFNFILKAPLIILALLLSSCRGANYITQSQLLLGTTVSISVGAHDVVLADKALIAAFGEIKRIENVMSYFKKDNLLNKLNSQASIKPVEISDELFYLIETCQKFSEFTGGAFDITATSLDEADGYKQIVLDIDKKTVFFKNKKARIDLGAAAKGYAVDRAITVLRSYGFNNALVNAGGDIYASGNYKGGKWAIGIRNPSKKDKIKDKIYLTNMAVATSGNYLRAHIIRTKDKNLKSNVVSATVIASSCLEADILATAVFVDPDAALKTAESLKGIEILLIKNMDQKLKETKTSGFMKYKVNKR